MNVLIALAIMILSGMALGRLAKFCKLPNVTGYLIAGLLIGPSVLNIIPAETIGKLDIISEVALGFIAFSIGNEFKISYFKRVGVTPIVIAVLESLVAVILVIAGLLIAGFPLPYALVLGAIAAATAPAATIMVIRQYKAKGPVTETLLSVVALDDAVALILFGLAVAIAQSLGNPGNSSILASMLQPTIEILGGVGLGFVMGLLMLIPLRWFKKDGNRMCLIFAFVFAGIGLADLLNLSALLLCMAMGAALANFSKDITHLSKLCDYVTPPIFLLFFVTSGAELDVSVLPTLGLVGVIYIVLRVIGKMAGASLGAWICKAPAVVRKYLGPALMPQAGVAIGLSLLATTVVPEYGASIRAVTLCATLIYELIGPAVAKLTLTKAGEIEPSVKKRKPEKTA
ncbi:MAG: cation:proton antiporter [Eubacteriales bacterium]|nr:cation:proton antiporter [Eubacteriales bacterium]